MSKVTIFGGERGWSADDWTASDDRVRGGNSHSYLTIGNGIATFHGHLDIETLGGAGFASQRTTGDDRHWDFSTTKAIELIIDTSKSDSKRYAFNLKDEILPVNSINGREQATTSWEYEFEVPSSSQGPDPLPLVSIIIPYKDFKPTYRGREDDPGHAIALANIRRISIMMRSFFGKQQGDFRLAIHSINTISDSSPQAEEDNVSTRSSSDSVDTMTKQVDLETSKVVEHTSIWQKLFSCTKL